MVSTCSCWSFLVVRRAEDAVCAGRQLLDALLRPTSLALEARLCPRRQEKPATPSTGSTLDLSESESAFLSPCLRLEEAPLAHGITDLSTSEDATYHFEVLHPRLLAQEAPPAAFRAAPRRATLVNAMVDLQQQLELQEASLYLAVQLLDRCALELQERPELPSALLLVAAKFEEDPRPSFQRFLESSLGAFSESELLCMEVKVLHNVGFKLHGATAETHLKAVRSFLPGLSSDSRLLLRYIAELSLTAPESSTWLPSLHAAAVVLLMHQLEKRSAPRVLADVWGSRGSRQRALQLEAIVARIWSLLDERCWGDELAGRATYAKFATAQNDSISEKVKRSMQSSRSSRERSRSARRV